MSLRVTLRRVCAAVVVVAALPACVIDRTGQSAPAAADREIRRTQERVSALEDHFKDQLKSTSQELSSVRKDSELTQTNLADSEAMLDDLIAQTQSTLGSLERLQRRLADLEEGQERLQSSVVFNIEEYDRRLGAIEQWARESEKGAPPPPVVSAVEPSAGKASGEADELSSSAATTIERARAALAADKPKSASKLLKDFGKRHPESPQIEEAMFLYAQALRADDKASDAISTYQLIIESFPASARLPEALLALGSILTELNAPEEARFFLGELVRLYPASSEAKTASKLLKAEPN